jgi:hypothetical protein
MIEMPFRKIKKLNRYWVSWRSELAPTLPFQYWRSGDETFCAVVDAPNKNTIRLLLKKHLPDYEERFIDEKDTSFVPGDRFPGFEGKTSFQ